MRPSTNPKFTALARGSLADIVSLVRFALHQEGELKPYRDEVNRRFANWLAKQESNGHNFTGEQR